MKQIRNNLFETNSSSSHSLVIRSDKMLNELGFKDSYCTHENMYDCVKNYLRKDGVYEDDNDEWYFGRAPFRIIDDFGTKFKYAYASYSYNKDKANEVIDLLMELVPEVKGVIKPYYAHTDENFLDEWLKEKNITIKEFLTNRKYVVVQDGDEYMIFDGFIESGIISTKDFE